MGFISVPEEVNLLSKHALDSAFKVHKELGPGLLESVYETCLFYELQELGLTVEKQVKLPIIYDGMQLDVELRLDIWLDQKLIVEVKSVESLLPIHEAQLLTYLKMTENRLGLLLNFNVPLLKQGIKRIVL